MGFQSYNRSESQIFKITILKRVFAAHGTKHDENEVSYYPVFLQKNP